MNVWFEGEGDVAADFEQVKAALAVPGPYHLGVVTRMPGLSEVTLEEHGPDFVTIKTNEGRMQRTNITTQVSAERVVVDYDEVYAAGNMVTATSHFCDTYTPGEVGVRHHLVISGVEAPGVLGFFYRNFGSGSIGKAVLEASRQHLEATARP